VTSQLIKLFLLLLKFGLPVLLAVGPLLALYGAVAKSPPPPIVESFPDQYPVLVGLAESCGVSCTSTSSYALLPSAFHDPKIVTVVRTGVAFEPIRELPNALISLIGSYLLCAVGTWWFWLRKRTPPNNSFKPKPLRGSA